jgi:FtsZ-interacting cell division protein YlmF
LQAIHASVAKQSVSTLPENMRTLLSRQQQACVVATGGRRIHMGLAQSLRAAVGQFGGAPDDYDDYADDDAFAGPEESERGDSAGYDEIYRDEPLRRSPRARERDPRPLALVRPPRTEFSLVAPQDFDDAQHIADRLRADVPVIVDLQSCGPDLAKRLTDFCSGLTYALDGSLEYLGEKVALLSPYNVELSSEAPGALNGRRFLNQI